MLRINDFGEWRAVDSEININVIYENDKLVNCEEVLFVYFTETDLFGVIHKTMSGKGLILVSTEEKLVKTAYKKHIRDIKW